MSKTDDKKSDSKMRNVCFTWNNHPDDYADQLTKLPAHTYIVYGVEVGDSGTPHIQGYVEFTESVRFSTLKKRLPKLHIEKRKGTAQQAADYCKKDNTDIHEDGTISQQGKRNDIDTVRNQLKGDGNLRTVVETASSGQSVRFAEIYLKYHEKQRYFKPTVTWLFGAAGTGKTRRAMDDAVAKGFADDIHTQTESSKWWDGYDGHKVVIMDDIRDSFCSYVRMLNLLDRYPCRIECKGGSRQLLAQHMYITSNVAPELLWATTEEKHQLLRRIDNIEEILSLNKSIIHKGNGVPLYHQEDIQEEASSAQDQDECETTSEFSYQEVRSESDAQERDEEHLEP